MTAADDAGRVLVLMRHAHAEAAGGSVPDRDRRLDERGRDESARMAGWLREQGVVPHLVVASTAARVRQTLEPFAAGWGGEVAVRYDERLYDGQPRAVLDVIAETPPAVSTLMVVGHNPTIQDLARRLGGVRGEFPACGVAVLRLGDWGDPLSGQVLAFATPATVG